MRYAKIDECEVVNGIGCGTSVYVQGCHAPHCPGCFNLETWDFNGGKEWTQEVENKFLKLVDKSYINRISILGGEPLADENMTEVYMLIRKLRKNYPNKQIWLYTGCTWEQIWSDVKQTLRGDNLYDARQWITMCCDVVVDGRFEEDKKDLALAFRGSTNQRVIDCQKSLEKGEVVLWTP